MIVIAIEDVNGIKALVSFGQEIVINGRRGVLTDASYDAKADRSYLTIRRSDDGGSSTFATTIIDSLEVIG